jgi:peptidoglycan/LPS O-acetylase OafA/YrhL
MDYTPLLYLVTPKDAAASVTSGQMIAFCISVILLTIVFGILYNRLIDRRFQGGEIK